MAHGASQCAIPRVVPRSARYHVCLSHTTGLSRMVPHSARYRAWCLTVRDTARGASHCAIPRVSVTHCRVILHGASQCAIQRVVPHSARYHLVSNKITLHYKNQNYAWLVNNLIVL